MTEYYDLENKPNFKQGDKITIDLLEWVFLKWELKWEKL